MFKRRKELLHEEKESQVKDLLLAGLPKMIHKNHLLYGKQEKHRLHRKRVGHLRALTKSKLVKRKLTKRREGPKSKSQQASPMTGLTDLRM